MMRTNIFFPAILLVTFISGTLTLPASEPDQFYYRPEISYQQTQREDFQLLYNGKVWRSLYYNIRGDEFLFSDDFLNGSVTINGKKFNNVGIRYDIYNDEIISPAKAGTFVQLNKEMVSGFDIDFNSVLYKFVKLTNDSSGTLNGYVNVLYEGRNNLYLKYRKEIKELAVEKKYDEFNQRQVMYLEHNGNYHKLTGKGDFLKIFKSENSKIKEYMKQEKIKVRKSQPESFIPVLKYIDNLP